MLDEVEHVALGVAGRVPPAVAVMVDDDDLAGSTPILQGPFRALTRIEFPATHHSLEDGRAVHGLAEQLQLRIGGCRHRVSPGLAGTAGGAPCPALSISGISPTGDREAGGVQGRRLVRRLRSGFPCGPTGASGSALLLCGFRHALGCAGQTCERRVFPRRSFGSSDPGSRTPEDARCSRDRGSPLLRVGLADTRKWLRDDVCPSACPASVRQIAAARIVDHVMDSAPFAVGRAQHRCLLMDQLLRLRHFRSAAIRTWQGAGAAAKMGGQLGPKAAYSSYPVG